MGKKNARKYPREFKLEAIRLAQTSEKTLTQLEEELGITKGLLSQWIKQSTSSSAPDFPGKGHQAPQEARVRELERENERLREEREILKKVLKLFSREER
jgi:transposase